MRACGNACEFSSDPKQETAKKLCSQRITCFGQMVLRSAFLLETSRLAFAKGSLTCDSWQLCVALFVYRSFTTARHTGQLRVTMQIEPRLSMSPQVVSNEVRCLVRRQNGISRLESRATRKPIETRQCSLLEVATDRSLHRRIRESLRKTPPTKGRDASEKIAGSGKRTPFEILTAPRLIQTSNTSLAERYYDPTADKTPDLRRHIR